MLASAIVVAGADRCWHQPLWWLQQIVAGYQEETLPSSVLLRCMALVLVAIVSGVRHCTL